MFWLCNLDSGGASSVPHATESPVNAYWTAFLTRMNICNVVDSSGIGFGVVCRKVSMKHRNKLLKSMECVSFLLQG